MRRNKHAKRLARMFLNAAGLTAAPEALKELGLVHALMLESPGFRSLLVGPQFSEEEKGMALQTVGRTLELSDTTVKFLGYLSEAQAAAALGEIIEKAVAIHAERMRRVKATVITAAEMDPRYEGRLRESLKRITERDVDIEYVTDPSLLGGMLVKVGSTMYDGSIKGQLRLLRDELIKG